MPTKLRSIKFVYVLLAIVTCANICNGQLYWNKTYGGTSTDYAKAITATPDGNFIVAGSTFSFGAGSLDVYLLKIKPNGDTLWTKTYGGTTHDYATAITPTADGNFIVAGSTLSFGAGRSDVYLLKIKPNGDTLWTKTYGGTTHDYATAITPTADGNFIVAGYICSFEPEISDAYLLKIRPNGDTLWTKTYGRDSTDYAFAIAPTADGNFIVAGSTSSLNAVDNDFYLLKIKPNGDTLWTKTYGGASWDRACAITPTPDGNFIVAGFTSLFGAGDDNVYLLKIKPNGDTMWIKTFGGTNWDYAFAITPTADGNFIVAGYTYSFGAETYDAYLLKIRPNGDTLWTKTYGRTDDDRAYAITTTPDGNFIVAGYTYSFGAGNTDVYLLNITDDRYAWKSSLFTYKLPVSVDSLNYGYKPVKVPSGMTVSLGGTISWTPTTDSVYMEHVKIYVFSDNGTGDSLSFNIFVNSTDVKNKVINPLSHSTLSSVKSKIGISSFPSHVLFSLGIKASSLGIFDTRGRLVEKLPVVNNAAIWKSGGAAGRYVAKVLDNGQNVVQSFVVMR